MTEAQLREWLTKRLAQAVGVEVAEVDADLPFREQGLDSAKAAEIAGELADLLDERLEATLLFEHPSISELAAALSHAGERLQVRTGPGRRSEPHEPLAVVGMACRMPGAPSVDAFWELLAEGRDALGSPPPGRWPDEPEAPGVASGGFLDDISGFDAGYFRIPVDEALRMDPQQRLLQEIAVECFEDAGVSDAGIRGSATGVFVGISSNEYGQRQIGDARALSAVTPTGNALSVAANRVSYMFDLRGPSIAVDTACSSSLVALHLAGRAIRAGECDVALVAGVNLLLDPETSIALSKAGFLAPDGRCKTFDASADGYVRAEGCGAVLLKRLSQARADGDRVYALVAGSAVNQDGRTNGLTAPNPAAQERVLLAAYEDAQIDPSTASYVECHGTGTFLGDPIELTALSRAVRGAERERPLLVGSVKTNVGHLEAAAGLAAFIKTALAVHAGSIPPSLNFETPNPNIQFDELGVEVVTRPTEWPASDQVAGVSSFGFGGTNAHVVLTAPPPRKERSGDGRPLLLPVSAKSPEAFAALADAFADHVSELTPDELPGFVASAATRRNHYEVRDAVVGSTPAELASRLGSLASAQVDDGPRPRAPRVAFVFAGHSSELQGVRGLMAHRLFRGVIERCDEILAGREPSIKDLILDDDLATRLEDTALAQPVIVAIQVAFVEMLSALGVLPVAAVGHSVGELAAAYAAGALTLDEVIELAARRGSAMAPTAGRGGMLAVGVDEAAAGQMVAGKEEEVVIAAVNGPAATVMSGRLDALREVEGEAASMGLFTRWLQTTYPFHSSEMEGAAAELAAEPPGEVSAEVAFYSTVVGGRGEDALAEPGYWTRNVREPVRFADAVTEIVADGIDILLEVGATSVLQTPLRQITRERDDVLCAGVHTAASEDESSFLEGLAVLYRSGVDLDWSRLWPQRQPFRPFPSYRWQHTPLLLERPSARKRRRKDEHALLGSRVDVAAADAPLVWESEIAPDDPGFLADHRVSDMVVFPASGYVELIVAAARAAGLTGALAVDDLEISALLVLDSDPVRLQTSAVLDGDGACRVEVHSRPLTEDGPWVLRASAGARGDAGAPGNVKLVDLQLRCLEQIPKVPFYGALAEVGLQYGPEFSRLDGIWRTEGEAFAQIPPDDPAFFVDPRSLDAAFQVVGAAAGIASSGDNDLWLPLGFDRMVVTGPLPAAELVVHASFSADTADVCDVEILGPAGEPFVAISGLRLQRAHARQAQGDDESRVWIYDVGWLEKDQDRARPDFHDETVVLVGADADSRMATALAGAGARVETLGPGDTSAPSRNGDDACALDSYRARLQALRAAGHRIGRLVYAAPPLESAGPDRAVDLCQDLVALIQAVSLSDGEALPELWIVTHGAHDGSDPFSAAMWGIAKVVPFENPALPVRCVDVDDSTESMTALAAEMATPTEDAEIAIREGRRYVRRILPRNAEPLASTLDLAADGVYVVSGGTGGVGPHVLAWLVSRGARHVAVLSRAGLPDDVRAETLRAEPSATLLDVRCDVSVRAEVESALAEIRGHGLPIHGVVHAAGVLADGALLSLSSDDVAEPLVPKVAGAWWLQELTADDPVEWFVLFSSAAAVLGSPGQANYAAANAFLDALAGSMRAGGRRVVSVDWGPWEVGMAAGMDRTDVNASISLLDSRDAVAALEQVLGDDQPQALVLPFDLRDLLQFFPTGLGFTLYEEVQTADVARLRSSGRQAGPAPRPAIATEYVAPRNDLEERIAQIWQQSLGIERVGISDRFFDLGGDSVFANQMVVEINQALGVAIDANRAFEEFTVARLAALAEESLVGRLASMTDEEAEALLAGSE